ncbi:MAG: GFA family protein [Alphaproteobacteria bacterium]|nr:GFA family protein [Alphaproteobacteria bacterium]
MARPPLPSPPYEGRCLCGKVSWRLDARPLGINACHCDDCKKLTGATHLLMLLAQRESFSDNGGATERYRKRADSGREIDIVRCAECGTRLWHEPLSAPSFIFVAAGTLDDVSWAVPASHIWIEKASPGVVMEDDALKLRGQPSERSALFDAFSRLYPG